MQLDSLKKCIAPSDVKKTLKSLPKTLHETYDRILLSIDERHWEKALIALRWISYSCQPIMIEELAEAVIIDPNISPSFNPHERIPDPDWLLEILSGLVVVSVTRQRPVYRRGMLTFKDIPVVNIAHFSVKEYLSSREILSGPASRFHILEGGAIEAIVQRCLLYIMCYSVSDRNSASSQDLDEFPLLLYVSHFWHEHLLAAKDSITTQTKDLVLDFLNSEALLLSWLQIYHPEDLFDAPFSPREYDIASPLYYLAFWGISDLVRMSINNGADINAQGGKYHTALKAAVRSGNTSTTKLLLEAGANPNAQGGLYSTALEAAVNNKDTVITKLLLEAGANFNDQGGLYGNPLAAAAWSGNTSVAKLLLEAGADVNAQGGLYSPAIIVVATGTGNASTMKLLLEAGADPNAQGGIYGTALAAAAINGEISTVELLLQAGADVNAQGGCYGTALHAAVKGEHTEVVATLIEAGADVNADVSPYGTAIQAAFECAPVKRMEIVNLLLVAGVNINVLDENERTKIQEICNSTL